MTSDTMRSSRVVALALIVGTFFVAQEVLTDLASGKSVSLANDVVVVLLFWVAWALLTPFVLMAVRRWPTDARPVYRPLLIHTVVAVVLSTVRYGITIVLQALGRAAAGEMSLLDSLRRGLNPNAFVWGLFTGVFYYAIVVMVYNVLRFRAMYTAERLSAAALESELTRSKLDTLRSQLRPHFLFNTLNAISVFVTEDAGKAQQMILRLSTLLRRSLDEEEHEVPLRQELAFVDDYLEIQRARFGDRLNVQLAVDPTLLDARVPVLLLQPLLENAIEHGKSDDNCTSVVLRAARERDVLCISVADNGPGIGNGTPVREGIGLNNTRARLHHLYGSRASVELGDARGELGAVHSELGAANSELGAVHSELGAAHSELGAVHSELAAARATAAPPGTRVEIRIPFREAPPQ